MDGDEFVRSSVSVRGGVVIGGDSGNRIGLISMSGSCSSLPRQRDSLSRTEEAALATVSVPRKGARPASEVALGRRKNPSESFGRNGDGNTDPDEMGDAGGDGDDHGKDETESVGRFDMALGGRRRISVGELGSGGESPLKSETGDPGGGSQGRTTTDPRLVPNEAEILGDSDGEGDKARGSERSGELVPSSLSRPKPSSTRSSVSGSRTREVDHDVLATLATRTTPGSASISVEEPVRGVSWVEISFVSQATMRSDPNRRVS